MIWGASSPLNSLGLYSLGRYPVRALGTAKNPRDLLVNINCVFLPSRIFTKNIKGRLWFKRNGEAIAKGEWVGCCAPNARGGTERLAFKGLRPKRDRLPKLCFFSAAWCRGIDPWLFPAPQRPKQGQTHVCTFQDTRPGWEAPASATIDLLSPILPAKPERTDPPLGVAKPVGRELLRCLAQEMPSRELIGGGPRGSRAAPWLLG